MRNGRVAAFIAAGGAAIALWLIGYWVAAAVDSALFVVAPWVAAGSAVWAARSSTGRQRVAWLCMAVGLVGWALGAASIVHIEAFLSGHPLSSADTWPFILFPIGLGVALLLFPPGLARRYVGRFILDAAIVAGLFFLIFWLVVMDEVYKVAGGVDHFMQILPVVYAALEIAVLTFALLLVVRAPSGQRSTLSLLTAGLLGVIVSDGAYTYISVSTAYSHGALVDIGWIAGMFLIAVAALSAPRSTVSVPKVRTESAWASAWLPGLTAVLVAVAAVTEPMVDLTSRPVLMLAAGLALAVFARQFLVISDNHRLLGEAADQALRDPLTGVANYTRFNERLTEAMQEREHDRVPVVVMMLDLNDFKLVNDSYGHPAGDRLLMLVGDRISEAVRPADTVARLGGDEFGIVMTGPIDDSYRIARRVVEAFDAPFVVDGHDLAIRPSAGVAAADTDGSAVDTDMLLKQADTAMYSAKWAGSGSVHVFTAEMDSVRVGRELFRTTEVSARGGPAVLTLLGELRQAVDRAELTVVYQPQFRLRTGDLIGFEALLRWPRPDGNVLAPHEFLPMIRRHGLMDAVTDFVFARATEDAVRWRAAGIDASVAVNVFAPSLADATLPARIGAALAVSGLPPASLTIEITEHMVLGDLEQTREVLHTLREQQIRIAIDDFGTGYSTLSYLRELPSDELKLDQQFIAPVLVDPTAAAVVRAVVGLAQELGITTVAEGVENAQTAEWLRRNGCDIAQGFLYGAPVDIDTVLERFAVQPSATPATAPASAKSN
ncbi:bifunctional diguanylate cyclase/phosphodiesterase [Mycobacterium sp. CVI_P3]|uniref:Bifunctional diguanylate cyclase/phosphodiesterase n=1 Tax=Mycobacterium pinniadriaticum TaxID=2994102 RepID=A0ABT3SIA7_9MYCO|nr:bifunctional diguanylate cyclase/phosphodiesterase [Mycobacterium pinniadriaticum]MCX2932836.1 bifunctional diguanylate cyclase/phosphodiesterase [Mycobacterium pinniadriaticum]MCX2939260.1 bifunctional diguanylate cyclase/phosphodiesterase [Mycobacterium pinniadriaticum]